MSKYIKVPSLQGSSNFTNGSLLDFDIADDGYYNLQNSYVSLSLGATSVEATPANTPSGIHAVNIDNASMLSLRNNCLV